MLADIIEKMKRDSRYKVTPLERPIELSDDEDDIDRIAAAVKKAGGGRNHTLEIVLESRNIQDKLAKDAQKRADKP